MFEKANGDIDVFWNEAEIDSSLEFKYYKLFGAQNINGPYSVLDSIAKKDSLQTTVAAAGGYKHFYMIKSTGECDFLSEESDTLSSMDLTLTATPPPPNSQFVDLEWTSLHTPILPTTRKFYEIWVKTTNGPWVLHDEVAEVPNVPANYKYQYTDTLNYCDEVLEFQIRLVDTIEGHISGSNYQSGQFSDKINGDILGPGQRHCSSW